MRIPLRISPFFFLTAAVIGYLNAGTLLGTLFWVAVIFISVLFHEYGHALLSLCFGQRPRIEIVAFGGVTYPDGPKLKLWQEFIVIFAGPFFGFLLFLGASFLLMLPIQNPYILYFLKALRFINLFWTLVNLVPVLPLDGGQLVRVVLEAFTGVKAWRYAHMVSFVVAVMLAILFFFINAYLIGGIFLLFAFQSFEGIRNTREMTEEDNRPTNREELQDIERLILQNRISEAKLELEDLRQKTGKGLLYTLSTEYLAKIYFDEGHQKEAYDLLKNEESHLTDEAKYLLHMAAFEMGDYSLALKLAAHCFRALQSVDIALRAAAASAAIKNASSAVEWLKTAKAYGISDFSDLLKDRVFDNIRSDEIFQKFLLSFPAK